MECIYITYVGLIFWQSQKPTSDTTGVAIAAVAAGLDVGESLDEPVGYQSVATDVGQGEESW